MKYIYPPLYKYIAFILIFFMFLKYYKVITQQNYLIIAIFATILIILLDYFLIEDYPNLINSETDTKTETEVALNNLIDSESDNDSDSESESELDTNDF